MSSFRDKILAYLKKYSEKVEKQPSENKSNVKLASSNDESANERTINPVDSNEFYDTMEKLDNKLKGVNEDYVLDKIEFTPISDEEIQQKVNEEKEHEYALKAEELKNNADKKRNELQVNNEAIKVGGEQKKEEINNAYAELGDKLEANAIKRGIARSSIVAEQLKSLDVDKIKDLLAVDDKVATQIKENSDKIEALEAEYKTAVSNLNLQKAIDIKEKIEEYKEAQNKKIEEVIKYNNTVKKQQLDINSKVENKPLKGNEAKEIERQMISLAIEYYLSLPKEERLKKFNDDFDIRNMLGDSVDFVKKYLVATE